jgi:hypothetical protein
MTMRGWIGSGIVLILGSMTLSMAGTAGPIEPMLPGPVERGGVSFQITGLSCTFSVSGGPPMHGVERTDRSLALSAMVKGGDGAFPCLVRPASITRLVDERGADLLAGAQQAQVEPTSRQWLRSALRNLAFDGPQRHPMMSQGMVTGLPRLPARIAELGGHMDAVVASKVERYRFALGVMEVPEVPVPGVTFLLSKVERTGDQVRLAYEWRIARSEGRSGQPAPGLEPLVVAAALRDHAGNIMMILDDFQEIETRDEYIAGSRPEVAYPQDVLERAAGLELVIVRGLAHERFEFSVKGVGVLDRP